MKRKIIFIGMVFLAIVWLPSLISPALACDPDRGDVADCGMVTPSTILSPVAPTAVVTQVALGIKPGDAAIPPTGAAVNGDPVFPLACLLPDGDSALNALGVASLCPASPLQIRAVKTPPPPPPAPKLVPTPTPVSPKGDSPGSAKTIVADALQTIEPGGVHWYKIDNGKNFYLDVWLDANGAKDITMSFFSPEQTNDLDVNTPPKGRGGSIKNEPHDLLWKGSFATGVWYALVRNYNTVPIQYKLGINQSTTDRNCVSYWEPIRGTMVLWTDCGHYQDVNNFGK